MEQGKRLDALTALKGIFILIIVFHNTMLFEPLFEAVPGSAFLTLFGGALGNSMFFLLSGFGMAFGYRDRIQSHAIAFGDFLGKRLKKLYPMYLASNFAALILAIVQYGASAINLQRIAFTVLMQMGGGLTGVDLYNTPTWFVCTLMLCYVVFFFTAYHCKTRTQYRSAIVGGIVLGYGLLTAGLKLPFCHADSGIGLMNFYIGCALAEAYPLLREKRQKWAAPGAFVTLLAIAYLLLRYGVEIICGNVQVAFAFCICPLIFYLAMADGLCTKILRWKPLVALGNISSSIYFWHLVLYSGAYALFYRIAPGQSIQEIHYLVFFVGLLVWSTLAHRIFERTQHPGKAEIRTT